MEARDISIIEENKDNYRLSKLYRDHLEFEMHIKSLAGAKGLGSRETAHLYELKRLKLEGREQIEEILTALR